MKFTCIIVDDEPIAQEVIESYISRVASLELVGKCSNAIDAYTFLQQGIDIDIIFLDIHMPQMNGLEFIKSLHKKPAIIVISAYREYALDGFDLDVADYLVKPVPFDRFMKAIGKVTSGSPVKEPAGILIEQEDPFLYVKEGKKVLKILLKDILYFESQRDYIKVVLLQNKFAVTRQTISYYEEKLPQRKFVRIHRSYIVAIEKITSISESAVSVGGVEIPIGNLYKENTLALLDVRKLF